MLRALSIYLPMWSIDLVRRRDRNRFRLPQSQLGDRRNGCRSSAVGHRHEPAESREPRAESQISPILLITMQHNVQVVAQCCEQAARCGVQPGGGMTLAHARALIQRTDCRVEDFDEGRDRKALERLAAWAAMRYSPLVAADPPDGLLIDITGCQRLFGGEERLLRLIVRDIQRLGFTVRAASASTFGCAWAVAHFGFLQSHNGSVESLGATASDHRESAVAPIAIVPPHRECEAIAPLPTRALRIDEDSIDGLSEVEIELIGHLFDLPRDQLASRFGSELLLRLDQATGGAFEIIDPIRPQFPPLVERIFDGPVIQIEAIELTVRELLEPLCAELLKRESGVRRLDLDCTRIDAQPLRQTVMLSRPSRNAKHLWSLLRPRLEKLNLGFGVERIALTATRTGSLPHEQHEHDLVARAFRPGVATDHIAGELIDTLAARLGPDRVKRIEPCESHLPERSFRLRAAMDDVPRQAMDAGLTPAERPTLMFQRPIRAAVELIDGRPSRLSWHGIAHRIASFRGPERIAEAWWYAAGLPSQLQGRDYFTICDDAGRHIWVYCELHTGRWFIHGVWA